ncbi:glycosyltransferase involved in cell wall biosynthesis [Acinetobacter calcoaceticus]|uniref:Glycosyltransferase involved in cell wall biosynthesis n=1 Tax=Acinetobacter calcoaceticus TaxID=471 RepID=A0A4R1XUH1_ACICA|nr:glycosyltransferase involved in cell wall biosynthesis [Acinetobacter calcoaceticus]
MATRGGIGGLESHCFNLCRELAAKGIEVHLLADQSYLSMQESLPQVQMHAFDFSKSRWNPFLLYQLYQCIKTIQPNLIHAQGGKASKIMAFLSSFIKQPTVATVHGMKNHLGDYKRFSAVIAVSGHVADKFKGLRSVDLIHNGVDIDPVLDRDQLVHQPRALAIGRLDPVKGFDHLIKAWVGIDYRLDIIGDGAEREHLQAIIEQHQLQDRVRLLGYKHPVNLEICQSSFVVVSSLKEGGPIVVAEALLQQVPIIATDVGMAKEFIPQQYIAKNNDVENLTKLIEFTLAHISQLPEEFNTAYRVAADTLTLTKMTQKTIAVYQRQLQEKTAKESLKV